MKNKLKLFPNSDIFQRQNSVESRILALSLWCTPQGMGVCHKQHQKTQLQPAWPCRSRL